MIVVTGAAGFIGSCLVSKLNALGNKNLILVDDFSCQEKNKNLENKQYIETIDRMLFIDWFSNNAFKIETVYHIGARTDTTELDSLIFDKLNLEYSKKLWNICVNNNIPIVYASSAATYGGGEFGFKDSHQIIHKLVPLNLYAESKNNFDKWVLSQHKAPPFWAGVKFFNVFGPNEFHKKRMSSVIFSAVNQIQLSGEVKLFRSHNSKYKHGEQSRDFIYVKDVIDVLVFLTKKTPESGIYNLGSGLARTFLDLVHATFSAMKIKPKVIFIDTPEDIRKKYQYFTQASMLKLQLAGYNKSFFNLEDGVKDYVQNYLLKSNYY